MMALSRLYALVLGAIYLLVGLVGFVVAPGLETRPLVIFDINLAHNLVHLALGVAGLAAYFGGFGTSRLYAQVVGMVLLVVALAGVCAVRQRVHRPQARAAAPAASAGAKKPA